MPRKRKAVLPSVAYQTAIWADRGLMREREWATVLAEYGAGDAEWKPGVDAIMELLAKAADAGDGDTFRRLAYCVERRHQLKGKTDDPLTRKITAWTRKTGLSTPGFFNIERFVRECHIGDDRDAIRWRVQALGFRLRNGRPKKT